MCGKGKLNESLYDEKGSVNPTWVLMWLVVPLAIVAVLVYALVAKPDPCERLRLWLSGCPVSDSPNSIRTAAGFFLRDAAFSETMKQEAPPEREG